MKKAFFIFPLIFLIFFFLLFSTCSASSAIDPYKLFTIPSDISINQDSASYKMRKLTLQEGTNITTSLISSSSRAFNLSVDKDSVYSIILTIDEDDYIGCIYPYSTTLTYNEGFCAKVLNEYCHLLSEGNNNNATIVSTVRRFNWNKFISSVRSLARMSTDNRYKYVGNKSKIESTAKSIYNDHFTISLLQ